MKPISILILSLMASACHTTAHEPKLAVNLELNNVELAQNFFLISYSETESNTLDIRKGMAVAVKTTKDDKCILLTSAHLVNGQSKFLVSPWSWQPAQPEQTPNAVANLINLDETLDIATLLLESPHLKCKPAVIDSKTKLNQIGQEVSTYGQPNPHHGFRAYGKIMGIMKINNIEHLVSDTFITPGFSGGGAYNSKGKLIGVNISRSQPDKVANPNLKSLSFILPTYLVQDHITASLSALKTASSTQPIKPKNEKAK
jgi:S1-C subfamily serine protease